jgi:hypothetical protein
MSNFSNSSSQKRQFFFQSGKKRSLIDYLTKEIQPNNSYHLILVSCYLNLDSVDELIESLKQSANLTKISIYIDRGTAIKIGKKDISDRINKISQNLGFEINFKIAKTANLFHAKAYCLLADDNSNGSLVLGSANLTDSGLIGIRGYGNVELLYETYDIEHITNFYSDLTKSSILEFIDISNLETFDETDEYYFQYALLLEGYFVQPYDITVENLLSFSYEFNKNTRSQTFKNILEEYEIETYDKGSMNYFKKIMDDINDILEKYNDNYQINWGRCGIKTYFGYWIPKKLVSYLEDFTSEKVELCKKEIQEKLESYLPRAKSNMRNSWNELSQEGFLKSDSINEINLEYAESKLKDIITKCLNNLDKCLKRYYIVKLDLDIVNSVIIKDLFEILENSSDLYKQSPDQNANQLTLFNPTDYTDYRATKDLYSKQRNFLLKCLSKSIEDKTLKIIQDLDSNSFRKHIKEKEKRKSQKSNKKRNDDTQSLIFN